MDRDQSNVPQQAGELQPNGRMKIIGLIGALLVLIVVSTILYRVLAPDISPEERLRIADSSAESISDMPQDSSAQESDDTQPDKMLAPDFTVLDQEGNRVQLSDLRGKPVVLNFWASWCPPCKSEMPEFNTVFEEMGETVTFMMVDLVDGEQETMENGKAYIAQQGFTFPVYFDNEQEAAMGYGLRSIPTTLFIDREGYIITGAQGMIDEATLRYGIEILLGGAQQ